jgi:Tfp pilus assembly protein PilF
MMRLSLFILLTCMSAPPSGGATPAPEPAQDEATQPIPVIDGQLAEACRLIEQDQTGPARIRIRQWMQANGDDARALFLFGLSYHRERRYAASTEWLSQAVDATPTYPPAAHFLGWSNYYLGDTAAADEAFRLHLRMTPTEGDTFYGLGLLALDAGELEEAQQRFNRAIELQQEQPDRIAGVSKAMVRLAEIDTLRGDRRAARAQLEAAVAVDPDRHEGWHRLARCCRRLGDHDAADHAERQRDAAIERTQPRQGFPE